jgi:DEAD/DEAH box helicase domain-containing protein
MSDILSLDIETANFSYDIGGWNNRTLFEPSVIATWDGSNGTIFSKEDIELEGVNTLPLHPRDIGDHLIDFINKGGKILGHNILKFDLPVIKDSLDCWAAGDVLSKHSESIIDTKVIVQKAALKHQRVATDLNMLASQNLKAEKMMSSLDAPVQWQNGNYNDVAEYCLKDAQLTYDLYKHMQDYSFVKSRSLETGEIVEIEIEW